MVEIKRKGRIQYPAPVRGEVSAVAQAKKRRHGKRVNTGCQRVWVPTYHNILRNQKQKENDYRP